MPLRVEDNIAELVPYVPGKPIEELKRELGLEHVVKLASNENPLGPSPRAVEVLRDIASRVHFYPDGGAYYFKERLAEKLGVSMDELLVSNGSNEAIELVIRTFWQPGTNAVLSASSFIIYKLVCAAVGVTVRETPLTSDMRFDLEAMAEAIDAQTRFVFVANPNNPTGTYVTRDELERFLARVPDHVVVGLDEAYFEYVSRSDYPDGLTLRAHHPNLVVFRTFSKCYGLAGARVGYAVAPQELIGYLNRVRAPFNCSALAQAAALAALDDDAFVARSVEHNARGRASLRAGVEELGLKCVDSVANFVLVELPMTAAEAFDALLEVGVIVRPMAAYGLPHHMRVSVGLDEDNQRFLDAMRTVLEESGARGDQG